MLLSQIQVILRTVTTARLNAIRDTLLDLASYALFALGFNNKYTAPINYTIHPYFLEVQLILREDGGPTSIIKQQINQTDIYLSASSDNRWVHSDCLVYT